MKPILDQHYQNKTEAAYGTLLTHRKMAGEILDFEYEPIKLIIARGIPGKRAELTYKPDFLVVFKDRFEFHEVKGHMRPQALVRLKAAAEKFHWFKFVIVRDGGGQWEYEEL